MYATYFSEAFCSSLKNIFWQTAIFPLQELTESEAELNCVCPHLTLSSMLWLGAKLTQLVFHYLAESISRQVTIDELLILYQVFCKAKITVMMGGLSDILILKKTFISNGNILKF